MHSFFFTMTNHYLSPSNIKQWTCRHRGLASVRTRDSERGANMNVISLISLGNARDLDDVLKLWRVLLTVEKKKERPSSVLPIAPSSKR
jgi:hypothetical protein